MAKNSFVEAVVASIVALILSVVIVTYSISTSTISLSPNAVNCVMLPLVGQSREGMGASLRPNGLALFLAEIYGAKASLPHIESTHGYGTEDCFSECQTPPDSGKLLQDDVTL